MFVLSSAAATTEMMPKSVAPASIDYVRELPRDQSGASKDTNSLSTAECNIDLSQASCASEMPLEELPLDQIEIDESGENDYGDTDDQNEIEDLYPEDKNLDLDPAEPTQAEPGSEEKIRVLVCRYANGAPLWHEKDRSNLEGANRELEGLGARRSRPKFIKRREPTSMPVREPELPPAPPTPRPSPAKQLSGGNLLSYYETLCCAVGRGVAQTDLDKFVAVHKKELIALGINPARFAGTAAKSQ